MVIWARTGGGSVRSRAASGAFSIHPSGDVRMHDSEGRTGSIPEVPVPRILIAEDHSVVRRGLRELLGPSAGWEVCGEARTGRKAVELARQLRPDVVVIDLRSPR